MQRILSFSWAQSEPKSISWENYELNYVCVVLLAIPKKALVWWSFVRSWCVDLTRFARLP